MKWNPFGRVDADDEEVTAATVVSTWEANPERVEVVEAAVWLEGQLHEAGDEGTIGGREVVESTDWYSASVEEYQAQQEQG